MLIDAIAGRLPDRAADLGLSLGDRLLGYLLFGEVPALLPSLAAAPPPALARLAALFVQG